MCGAAIFLAVVLPNLAGDNNCRTPVGKLDANAELIDDESKVIDAQANVIRQAKNTVQTLQEEMGKIQQLRKLIASLNETIAEQNRTLEQQAAELNKTKAKVQDLNNTVGELASLPGWSSPWSGFSHCPCFEKQIEAHILSWCFCPLWLKEYYHTHLWYTIIFLLL